MKGNKMQEALNKQINAELYSAYLYFAMEVYFEENNLKGCAHWMHLQAEEEMGHAMMFLRYVHDRRWEVELGDIAASTTMWNSPLDVFETAFGHEQKVTEMVNNLMDIAVSLKDYASQSRLKWFIDEQVEEEASFDEIVQKITIIGTDKVELLRLDHELGKRNAD